MCVCVCVRVCLCVYFVCRFEVYIILCVGACMFASCGLLIKIIGLPDN